MEDNGHQRTGALGHGAGDFGELDGLLAGDFERRIGEDGEPDAPVLAEDRGFGLGAQMEGGERGGISG